jgi:RimJ/RimL family protein N-acetyltransferase
MGEHRHGTAFRKSSRNLLFLGVSAIKIPLTMTVIETERLILKLYEEKGRVDFIALLTDERVMRYVDKGVMSPEAAGALWEKMMTLYGQGVDTIWAVFARDDGRYVGNASIRPRTERRSDREIGYYLLEAEWGKGLGTELARALVEYGFEKLGLRAVYATVDYRNGASIRILEKVGMCFYEEIMDEQGTFCVYRIVRN